MQFERNYKKNERFRESKLCVCFENRFIEDTTKSQCKKQKKKIKIENRKIEWKLVIKIKSKKNEIKRNIFISGTKIQTNTSNQSNPLHSHCTYKTDEKRKKNTHAKKTQTISRRHLYNGINGQHE